MSSNEQNNPAPIGGALTFTARNEENVHPLSVQPRQPTNLQGLLRFAMEATKAEDAPGVSELTPMDEERRKFLEEALKSLTVDMAVVIKDAIKVLTDSEKVTSVKVGDELPQDVRTAFNNLLELVDDIDVAVDFHKLGGFKIFPICYSCENDEVRALASTILGECCQNNPYCQQRALDTGLLDVLLNLVQTERGGALVKCLFALSCCCREYPPACHALLSRDTCPVLVSLLSAPETSVRTKAAFLIRYLTYNYPEAKQKFLELRLIHTIRDKIVTGRDDTTEHLVSIIQSLLENHDANTIAQCHQADLKNVLEKHLNHPDLVDNTFLEEKEYCNNVIDVLKSVKSDANDAVNLEVDR